jgi:NAD(P) transhydrogenase subunit alpha
METGARIVGALIVGVLTERMPGERRVALDPAVVRKLTTAGRTVLIERGAGVLASMPDADYAAAGATLTTGDDVLSRSSVIAVVRPPDQRIVDGLHAGQLLIGLLDPLTELDTVRTLADRGVTAAAFELMPRTLSRAQAMDALSSQASAAGYRAAIVAAETFGRYLAMMITASGTATPAKVIVIGAGVAGLQAIATLRRLGAVVTGYDVRAASQREVESLGAQFLTPSVAAGAATGDGAGGYARPLTDHERRLQQAELAQALVAFDVIITTAKVPGRTPPVLVTAQTLAALKCGCVCIDLGASTRGGNVAGSVPGRTTVTPGGVTVVGAGELASELPTSSSQMYARNVLAVITSLAPGDEVVVDPDDEVHRSIVVSHGGEIVSQHVREALAHQSLIEAKAS